VLVIHHGHESDGSAVDDDFSVGGRAIGKWD
jgi:hypothetical protein